MRCCRMLRMAPSRLIGATTENPSFEVNGALLSRCRVVTLNALSDDELGILVDRALGDAERGLGTLHAHLDPEARQLLLNSGERRCPGRP